MYPITASTDKTIKSANNIITALENIIVQTFFLKDLPVKCEHNLMDALCRLEKVTGGTYDIGNYSITTFRTATTLTYDAEDSDGIVFIARYLVETSVGFTLFALVDWLSKKIPEVDRDRFRLGTFSRLLDQRNS